jgi:hypothetical protein
LGELLKTHAIRRTRLFIYGPLALAVFLGQQLTSVGTIELYECQWYVGHLRLRLVIVGFHAIQELRRLAHG